MNRILCICFLGFVFALATAKAQRIYVTGFYGGATYKGDLQERSIYLHHAKSAASFGFNVEVTPRIFIKGEFSMAKITASDRHNPKNRPRNLSFTSDLEEVSVVAEYNAFDLHEYPFSPFIFAGFGYLSFNPYEELSNGARVFLSQLSTEGQGFIQGIEKYSLGTWCIPVGGGLQYQIASNFRIAAQFGYRFTGTDYLDDVSTNYVDKDLLRANRGQTAVSYAYRGYLIPNGQPYPAAGTPRGNPKNKDLYLFSGCSLRYLLQAHGKRKERKIKKDKYHMGCPNI
jgi:hypothetical protein